MEVRNFAYDTNAVSKEQFEQHIKLYKGYVTKSNEISADLQHCDRLANQSSIYSKYRELKKEQSYALDGVILHELYFSNMTAKNKSPRKKTTEAFERYFGSFKSWQEDFIACCMSARGWCITAYEQRSNSLKNILQDSHDNGVICMAYPIVVMDMYEHAYFLDYATDKEKYIRHFLQSICWDTVEKRVCDALD